MFVFVLLINPGLTAQRPHWVDYNWRAENLPESDYIVAFISGANNTGENSNDLLNRYEEQARANLIQQIQVQVQTATDFRIANLDAKTTEAFKMRSVSLSRADIAGMRTERFYDKRRNEAFAIARVNKAELIYYYKNVINNTINQIDAKLNTGENYRKRNNTQQALKSYYETMPLFAHLEEAQFILIALGQSAENDLKFLQGNNSNQLARNAINSLQQRPRTDLDELSYFMAYGLFLQLGEISDPLYVSPLGFESSGLHSEFSERFHQAFKRSLIRAGNYRIESNPDRTNQSGQLIADGTYWREGDELKANTTVWQQGIAVAAAEVAMPLAWVRDNNINWVPEQFLKINLLKSIKISPLEANLEGKAGRPLDAPLQVKLILENDEGQPLANAPVNFVLGPAQELLCTSTTDQNGVATCYIKSLEASRQVQMAQALLDVAAFAGLEPNSAFLKQVENTYPVSPARFLIKVAPLTIFVQSSERDHYNRTLDVNLLEPALKDILAASGYAFTDQLSQADLMVDISAKARHGSNVQGIYFSFVDANLSVIDLKDGTETWKTVISSIKGAGADYRRATVKAFEETAAEIKQSMPQKIN
jgi:hypothetical protein